MVGSCTKGSAVQVGMSQVDSLGDCLLYCSSLYTQIHGLCATLGAVKLRVMGGLWKILEGF
jgi:hypothetical protein